MGSKVFLSLDKSKVHLLSPQTCVSIDEVTESVDPAITSLKTTEVDQMRGLGFRFICSGWMDFFYIPKRMWPGVVQWTTLIQRSTIDPEIVVASSIKMALYEMELEASYIDSCVGGQSKPAVVSPAGGDICGMLVA
jgi:hypothetical protein